jgi:cysteinyl-tRNA synthetase
MTKRLGRYIAKLPETSEERTGRGKLKFHEISRDFRDNQQAFMQEFVEKLEDDFDTVSAMTIVFEFQGYVNSGIDDAVFSLEEARSLLDLMKSWNEVLAILDFGLLESEDIPTDITELALSRYDAKIAKNWAEADRIRNELANLGWKMIDEKDGWRVEKI